MFQVKTVRAIILNDIKYNSLSAQKYIPKSNFGDHFFLREKFKIILDMFLFD